ncbi:MAG: hypothetical protein ACR2H3_17185 [Acidimicrobiales bacterium]
MRNLALIGSWLMVAAIFSLLFGLARRPPSWLWLGALFGVVPTQIAWQLSRGRRSVVIAALTSGLLVAGAVAVSTPLTHDELRAEVRRLVVADAWSISTTLSTGDPLCLKQCPTVTARWEVDDAGSVAALTAVDVLRGAGYRVLVSETRDAVTLRGSNGRLRVDGVVTGVDRPTVALTLTSVSAVG